MLGPKLKVGTVWGFGDLSGEIHTHWSVSFLSDWEDMGDRLVGIWVEGSSNRYLCTDMGSLKVSQNPWGKWGVELYRISIGSKRLFSPRRRRVILHECQGASIRFVPRRKRLFRDSALFACDREKLICYTSTGQALNTSLQDS